VVYTGILPITQTEAGLAVGMGHEIAHAFAKHGSERMTQGLLINMGGMALESAIEKRPAQTQELFKQSYGIGTQLGFLLPFSRVHENEADHLGLMFMAMAGYDPHEAVAFWQRMSAAKKGAKVPQFLRTQPMRPESKISRPSSPKPCNTTASSKEKNFICALSNML
jgi:predicted Zn-dependent protease